MPKKKYKTVDEAAWNAARKFKTKGPEYDVPIPDENPFGYGTKLNKATGSPKTHKDGLGPPIKKPKPSKSSTATKSLNRFKKTGYLA